MKAFKVQWAVERNLHKIVNGVFVKQEDLCC